MKNAIMNQLDSMFKPGDLVRCASHIKDEAILNGYIFKRNEAYFSDTTKFLTRLYIVTKDGEIAENLTNPITPADYLILQKLLEYERNTNRKSKGTF